MGGVSVGDAATGTMPMPSKLPLPLLLLLLIMYTPPARPLCSAVALIKVFPTIVVVLLIVELLQDAIVEFSSISCFNWKLKYDTDVVLLASAILKELEEIIHF